MPWVRQAGAVHQFPRLLGTLCSQPLSPVQVDFTWDGANSSIPCPSNFLKMKMLLLGTGSTHSLGTNSARSWERTDSRDRFHPKWTLQRSNSVIRRKDPASNGGGIGRSLAGRGWAGGLFRSRNIDQVWHQVY